MIAVNLLNILRCEVCDLKLTAQGIANGSKICRYCRDFGRRHGELRLRDGTRVPFVPLMRRLPS